MVSLRHAQCKKSVAGVGCLIIVCAVMPASDMCGPASPMLFVPQTCNLSIRTIAALAFVAARTLDELDLYADKDGVMSFMRYFGKYPANTTLEEVQDLFLPYRYGHPTEARFCCCWLLLLSCCCCCCLLVESRGI